MVDKITLKLAVAASLCGGMHVAAGLSDAPASCPLNLTQSGNKIRHCNCSLDMQEGGNPTINVRSCATIGQTTPNNCRMPG